MLDLELDTRSKKQINRVFQVQRSSSSPLYRIIYTKQSFFSSSFDRKNVNKRVNRAREIKDHSKNTIDPLSEAE